MMDQWREVLERRGDRVVASLECPSRPALLRALRDHFEQCRGRGCGVFAIVHGAEADGAWTDVQPEGPVPAGGGGGGGGGGDSSNDHVSWDDLESLGALDLGRGGQLFVVSDSCYSAKMGKRAFAAARRRHHAAIAAVAADTPPIATAAAIAPAAAAAAGGGGVSAVPVDDHDDGRTTMPNPPSTLAFLAASERPEKNFSCRFGLEVMRKRRILTGECRANLRQSWREDCAGDEGGGNRDEAENKRQQMLLRGAVELVERIPVESDDFEPWFFFYSPVEAVADMGVSSVYAL